MTQDELRRDMETRAAAEREAGGDIEIYYGLPLIVVTLSDGSEYFFQGEEAEDLLKEVPDWIDEEDYILASAQNW